MLAQDLLRSQSKKTGYTLAFMCLYVFMFVHLPPLVSVCPIYSLSLKHTLVVYFWFLPQQPTREWYKTKAWKTWHFAWNRFRRWCIRGGPLMRFTHKRHIPRILLKALCRRLVVRIKNYIQYRADYWNVHLAFTTTMLLFSVKPCNSNRLEHLFDY